MTRNDEFKVGGAARTPAQGGFTLIELMIVVAVVAILLGIAYPSYENYVLRANRAEGKALLLRIAAEQEKFFTSFNRYAGSITDARPTGLSMDADTAESATDVAYYVATLTVPADGQTFSIAGAATGSQQSHDICGTLTIDSRGVKGITGGSGGATAESCW